MKILKSALFEVSAIMLFLQGAKIIIEYSINPYFSTIGFYEKMITMFVMLLLAGVVILYSKLRKIDLSVFPDKFSKGYIIATVLAAVLLIATPSNYTGGIKEIAVLFYGSIVTPIYEEPLFRGFIWNRLAKVYKGKYTVYILTSVLFGIWHIGYIIPQLLAGNVFAVASKVAVGLGYGFILGFIRTKTKNCYSTMLLHGIMNLFAF